MSSFVLSILECMIGRKLLKECLRDLRVLVLSARLVNLCYIHNMSTSRLTYS